MVAQGGGVAEASPYRCSITPVVMPRLTPSRTATHRRPTHCGMKRAHMDPLTPIASWLETRCRAKGVGDAVEPERQLPRDLLVRTDVPLQPHVRPRRDLRLLSGNSGLRHPRG